MVKMINEKLEEFKNRVRGKKAAVLGIGISNTPLIKYLAHLGAKITAFDGASREKLTGRLKELEGYDIEYRLGDNYLEGLSGFDIIFKTPSMRPDIPQLIAAGRNGAEITSEMDLFMDLCPARIFGVTGSDGKTTTTTVIYEILKQQGYKCWLGGNIGTPLLDRIEEIGKDDMVVLELSSFQLMTAKHSPDVAVITNISPNHLDIHKSMDEYVDAKKNIFRHQGKNDLLVLNKDNNASRKLADETQSRVLFFSAAEEVGEGTFILENSIAWKDSKGTRKLVDIDKILVPGRHNVENMLAAAAATAMFTDTDTIKTAIENFRGVEHRMESVREINGIRFINDSIATSPTRTIAGLESFNEKVILIAGGKDKKNDYSELGKTIAQKVKCLVLIGETADSIEKAYYNEVKRSGLTQETVVIKCANLEDAVVTAYLHAKSGDVVILSPASTSFDMYANFEEKGRHFKKLVDMLQPDY